MATPSFQSGVDGTAYIGTKELPVVRWTVNNAAEIVRFRNSQTNTTTIKQGTYHDAPFTIVIDWDTANLIYDISTPLITVGAIISNVKLYCNRGTVSGGLPGADALYWNFPSAIVVSNPMSMEVTGKVGVSINCENSGVYYPPKETPAS